MNYIALGNGNSIIFLHGWGLDSTAFFYCHKYFENYKCIFVDLFGFGKSQINSTKTLSDYANAIIDIIKENNCVNPILIGHSFGGKVAMSVSAIYPIKKLVLIDASGIKPKFNLRKYIEIKKYKLKKKLKLNVDKLGSQDFKNTSGCLRDTFLKVVNTHLDNKLKNIKAKTLIFWGNKDNVTPLYMAKRLHKGIKNSELVYLNGDHFAYTQDEKFIDLLKAFVDECNTNNFYNNN